MTGLALLQRGIATPLLVRTACRSVDALTRQHLPRPYTFGTLEAFKAGLRATGEKIRSGPPVSDGPIVIGLTGCVSD